MAEMNGWCFECGEWRRVVLKGETCAKCGKDLFLDPTPPRAQHIVVSRKANGALQQERIA